MMFKKYFSIIFIVLIISQIFAQKVTVSGTLLDTTSLPVSYVNISFDGLDGNGSNFVESMTNGDGVFSVELTVGKYIMIIQPPVGNLIEREETFLENTDLGVITLSNAIELSQTVVIGDKPLYRLELDKRVYDMSRDVTVKGASLSDALNNVPSVQVDGEGTLSLRGDTSVRVLINGKPSALTGISNMGDALRNIQADQVERVEVITNPSARYDAAGSGGIINIIMKKGSRQGFNASISSNIGVPLRTGLSADLNYKTQKWNFFINPSVRYRENEGTRDYENHRYFENLPEIVDFQNSKPHRKMKSYGGNIGLEHFLNENTTISASGNFRISDDESKNDRYSKTFSNDQLIEQSLRTTREDEDEYDIEGVLGFKHEFNSKGHQLDIQASGSWSEENEFADISDITSLGNVTDTFETNTNDRSQSRWLVQGDYVFPMENQGRFEFGSKLELENNVSTFFVENLLNNQWVLNEGLSDKLKNDQNIFALYSQYGKRYGRFSYLAGLRMERSDITIDSESADDDKGNNKNYTNWFPSATVNYYLDDAEQNQIQVSYSTRIRRPRGRWLSPFRNRSDDRNIFIGNPQLDPVVSRNIELSYITQIKKTTLTPSIYYQSSKDDMTILRRLTELDGQSVFLSMPVNAGDEERYGAELVASSQFASWWKIFGNVNFFGYKSTGSYVDKVDDKVYDLSSDGFSWFGRVSNTLSLPKQINMQLSGFYYGGQNNAQSDRDPMWSIDMGLTKDILGGDGTLTFNANDIFNSRRRKIHNFGTDYDSYIDMQWRPRTFTLNFTYRINQKKERKRGRNGSGDGEGEGMEI